MQNNPPRNTLIMATLREEVLALKDELAKKTLEMFRRRMVEMVGQDVCDSVSDVRFTQPMADAKARCSECKSDEKTIWEINYTHNTAEFHPSMYDINSDSETDSNTSTVKPVPTTTKITISKRGRRFFIQGGNVQFNIYYNSEDKIRIINKDYCEGMSLEDYDILASYYANTSCIPESFALAILLYLNKHRWDDGALATYLTVV